MDSKPSNLKILQINLQRAKAASSEALHMALSKDVDLLVIQEPYVVNEKVAMLGSGKVLTTKCSDHRIKTGIVVYNKGLTVQLITQHSTSYFTTVRVETPRDSLYVISFYCSPDEDLGPPLEMLGKSMDCLSHNSVLILGDFNAKSHLWHSPVEDPRGFRLCEFMAMFNLTSLNESPLPTYSTARGESWVDVCLGNPTILNQDIYCSTVDHCSASDHNYIETIIKDNKIPHLPRRFSPHQSGFRRNRSTTDNLVKLETSIREAFVRRQHLVSVFFDIEKAYDRCWRYGILCYLHEFGLRGNLPVFIKSFLQNRRFQVRMGNTLSRSFVQEEGVHQGCILSVTLFLIKINSIANYLPPSVKHSLYVDDFQISCQSSNMSFIERQLQTSLNRIDHWSNTNGFSFNTEKTSCTHFCRRCGLHLDPEIYLNGVKILMVNEAKFLGVLFDHKLTFLPHLRNLKSRCLKSMNLLKVLCCSSWGADKCSMLRIYRALVRSKLDYGCIVYGSARESTLRMLDPIHHQALRLCTGAFRTSPVRSMYVDAYEPPLSLRREQLSLFYYIKQKSFSKPSVDCTVLDTQLKRLFEARPSSVPLFAIRMENVSSTIDLDTGNISQLEVCSVSPWSTPVINVDLSLKQFPKESTPDYVYRQHFAEIQHSNRNLIPIYTDGSKSDDYVGSAFVCQDEIVAEQIALNSSIFSAELHAIYLALKHVNRKGHRCCVIYTDSVSALQALISCEPSSHSIVIKIHNLICHLFTRNLSIKFCWVPGHVGIRGNEEADAAAKAASPSQHEMCLEGSDLKLVVKKRLAERWQNMWNAQIHNKLHEIKPNIENWTRNKHYDRRFEVILTRLRIGHTRLTHLYLLKGEDQPVCEYCNCTLSVKHMLCNCSAFKTRHRQYFGNACLTEILSQRPNVNNLLDFLKVTNIYKQI
ncbi:uncharacterized protein LOC111614875 [Centruroides sculpturatus]|uniref:uncharacterized protein LOC111614875 n=1 Tax=Centruroides sculpturatus TaxID=218467 RepID=UPI000C6EDCA7|nr:uncharacterized protein LOC111614875 [Centruroides sculpturatus]